MSATAADLIRIAEGQVGYVEQGGSTGHNGNLTQFGKAYGLDGYAWCSIFVWWCFHTLGIDVRHTVAANYSGAEQAMEGFFRHGWKVAGTDHQPHPGDVVFFHFDGEHSGANHTGIVVSADAGGVHTIEGNTSTGDRGSQVNGGGVYRRYRRWGVVIGYGRYPLPTAAPQPAPPARQYPTLKQPMGSAGPPSSDVHNMQKLLHLNADGIYDSRTAKAVGRFQAAHSLHVDNIAGPATLRRMGF
jgi:hypothetical protein